MPGGSVEREETPRQAAMRKWRKKQV
nr:hypothetical protein [Pseudomonas putida]